MFAMYEELCRLEQENKPIRIAIIGAGQMGRGLVSQTVKMKGIVPAVVSDMYVDRAESALLNAGVAVESIVMAETSAQAAELIKAGKYVITSDPQVAVKAEGIDCVVEATGSTEHGARMAYDAIMAHKNIVMLNVETDVVVGPLLHKMAKQEGVVYTGSAGDEPGAVMELYNFAKALNLDILAIGKGKNNKVDLTMTPDRAAEEAAQKRMNPRMLTSFIDGSKTMVELNAMSNATGFVPAVVNGSGYEATAKELDRVYRLKEDGGILEHYGVVDYINGVAPGVFCIVTSPIEEVRQEITYLKLGDGPNYCLYRPFHLASLETPISIVRAVLHGKPTIVSIDGAPYSETTTYAKRDLKAGEYLDSMGGYTVYGGLQSYQSAKAANALPIGLVNERTRLKVDVKQGQMLTYDMVELDESSFLLSLRRKQDKMLANGLL
ncbi:MAG: NAD(P)-dependent oxidoreductase [Oscillospiraceae bacterium]|nr:NAD(P)-dependent oxidoreductase [Oscillospiraceae bacterium]